MAENALAAGGNATAAAAASTSEEKAPEMSRRRSSTQRGAAAGPASEESDADDGFEDASSLGGAHDSPRSEDIRIPTANKAPGRRDTLWASPVIM